MKGSRQVLLVGDPTGRGIFSVEIYIEMIIENIKGQVFVNRPKTKNILKGLDNLF